MKRRFTIVVAAATIAALTVPPYGGGLAHASEIASTKHVREAVTVDGVFQHLAEFQRYATEHDGRRSAGTPGYDFSASYVAQTLRAAGLSVRRQEFSVPLFHELAPATLTRLSPSVVSYEVKTFGFSGTGDVSGSVVPTSDVVIPPPPDPGSTSGCEPADFVPAAQSEAQIALIQRGGCFFETKIQNAVQAGYDAVIIFNEGQPGREEIVDGELASEAAVPVVGLSFADGAALHSASQSDGLTARIVTSTEVVVAKTANVIAETNGGDPQQVLLVGAHLDSVAEGPGINDNGSGVAVALELAEQIGALKLRPRNKIRFVFYGAEEVATLRTDGVSIGLLGSDQYVVSLSAGERKNIFASLNLDMLGSPNYGRFVVDGDGSDTGLPGPEGSGNIEQLFTDYFAAQHLSALPTPPITWAGGDDLGPVINAGIPSGGVFSGDLRVKTDEEAVLFGGAAGEPYDTCYHSTCDDLQNVSRPAIDDLGDAAVHVIWLLASKKWQWAKRPSAANPARPGQNAEWRCDHRLH